VDYSYNYLAGGMATVNVPDEWVEKLNLFDHEEELNDRRERRQHVYISNLPEGKEQWVSREPDPLQAVCMMERYEELIKKLGTLTPRQIEVLAKRLKGMSNREIARQERKDKRAIDDTLKQIQRKFLKDTPQNGIFEANI